MTTNGIKGYGTKIYYGTVDTPAATPIGQVLDVTAPNITADDIEITNNDSPDDFKEYIPGLKDGGTVSFDTIYEEATQAELDAIVGTLKSFKVLYPDDSYHSFNGYINALGLASPVNDAIKNSITIKVAGKPTFTETSG